MTTTFELNPNALKWVEALESGEYKQGRGQLHIARNDSYCCLGVACEVAIANGVPVIIQHTPDGKLYDDYRSDLPPSVIDWLGLLTSEGVYRPSPLYPHANTRRLTSDNDTAEHDFQRIAQTIRTTPSLFRDQTVD